MDTKLGRSVITAAVASLIDAGISLAAGQEVLPAQRGTQPRTNRLYVFDCGTLHIANLGRFRLTKEDVPTSDLSVPCFLVVNPKGTLVWDAGAIPDTAWKPTGSAVQHHLVLPDSQQRDLTLRKALRAQLAEIGYAPGDVTYLALSHYHYDHTANANMFSDATWLVRPAAMTDVREARTALEALLAEAAGIPVMVSMTFERRKRGWFTIMGDPLVESLRTLVAEKLA
jgi:glyoxylase-like metal-dependent hydrolase (beta-lactamase superfamily II)